MPAMYRVWRCRMLTYLSQSVLGLAALACFALAPIGCTPSGKPTGGAFRDGAEHESKKVVLRADILVDEAVVHPCLGCNLAQRDTVWPVFGEQCGCGCDEPPNDLFPADLLGG